MRAKLTAKFIDEISAPDRGAAFYWDDSFGLMVTASGHKSFVVQYRVGDRSRRVTLKKGLTLQEARREAKAIIGAVAKGGDPLEDRRKAKAATRDTVEAICEEFLRREGGMTRDADGEPVFSGKMRSADQYRRVLERLVYPALGDRQIDTIKRSEIIPWLDRIEDEGGPAMTHKALRIVSRVFNWHASRSDDFRSPIVRMSRGSPGVRDRVLTDPELTSIWMATEATPYPYGPLVRLVLLTGVRRAEAAEMAWSELAGHDWIIPAARMKGKLEHIVPLSPAARELLDGLPKIGSAVFTVNGWRPYTALRASKAILDEASGVTGWRLHDLRRTARSLMSRAGVTPDIAERCLAHKIGGIRGVYDRYAYHKEKKAAFEALAALVERIVHPSDNVIELARSGAG